MSTKEATRFLANLVGDEDLRTRYWESVERATVAAAVELAGAAGYDFTTDELRRELDAQAGQLSDDELDAVAGGAEPLLAEGGLDLRTRVLLPFVRFNKPSI